MSKKICTICDKDGMSFRDGVCIQCRVAESSMRMMAEGKLRWRYADPSVNKVCETCGKELSVVKFMPSNFNKDFLSNSCYKCLGEDKQPGPPDYFNNGYK